jgi:CheY-like chemotaxis protein
MVDKSELETALISLMTNARDAMPEGGTVTLSARMDIIGTEGHRLAALDAGRYVRIAVSDSGNGMDAATLARAAEPFFTTKPTGSSTGLGLSMAKGFAGQSGGGLTIESAPGRGTIVTMWLPVTDEIGQKPELRPVARLTTPDGKSMPRVLLVDNEEMVRESLAAGLEDAGLSVLVAQSGTEALALLDAGEPIDVLVSDYAMPGMDGLTLIRQAQERRRDLPSVIMTGYIEVLGTKAADKSRDSGLSVLRKPIGAAGLASSIADILVTRERNVGSGRR